MKAQVLLHNNRSVELEGTPEEIAKATIQLLSHDPQIKEEKKNPYFPGTMDHFRFEAGFESLEETLRHMNQRHTEPVVRMTSEQYRQFFVDCNYPIAPQVPSLLEKHGWLIIKTPSFVEYGASREDFKKSTDN